MSHNSIFFFKQKTAYEIKECDWSSDVCSSDLTKKLAIMPGNNNIDKAKIIGITPAGLMLNGK